MYFSLFVLVGITMKNRQGGRGGGGGGGAMLQVAIERLRMALTLGLRPSLNGMKCKTWTNNDAEVQGQAIRAMVNLVAVLKSSRTKLSFLHKTLCEDLLAALGGLLRSEREQVYSAAVDVAASLVTADGLSVLRIGDLILVDPLLCLLSCSNGCTSASAAETIRTIIQISKGKNIFDHQKLWKLLKQANVVETLTSRLQSVSTNDVEGSAIFTAFADLLVLILRQWQISRYTTGRNHKFRACLLQHCRSNDDATSSAALRLCASLALCGGVASLQIKDGEITWSSISDSLHPSKSINQRVEAFRFLALLTRLPGACPSINSCHLEALSKRIVETIAEVTNLRKDRWPPSLETMVLEACSAARNVLYWKGKHHSFFWRAGIVRILSELLPWRGYGSMQKYDSSDSDRLYNSFVFDECIRPLLWDVLGFLAVHAQSFAEKSLDESGEKPDFIALLSFACEVLLRVVGRRGRIQDPLVIGKSSGGIDSTAIPNVSICKALLFLLLSPSTYISTTTRHCLETTLALHPCDWILSLVQKLSVQFNSTVVTDDYAAIANLLAVGSLSNLEVYKNKLLKEGALEVLALGIKTHNYCDVHSKVLTIGTSTGSFFTCCHGGNVSWEGENAILFFSLCAYASLAQGSDFAETLRETIKSRLSSVSNRQLVQDGTIESALLSLVSDTRSPPGLCHWASCCLARSGVFGFPIPGHGFIEIFDDPVSADVVLVLADGNRLHVHNLILATKCPTLLPPTVEDFACLKVDDIGKTRRRHEAAVELHLSARLHLAPVRAVMEYLYQGFTFVEDEILPEVRLLAKRCNLDHLLRLLQWKAPLWGDAAAPCDLTSALNGHALKFSDIVLQAIDEDEMICTSCSWRNSHMHAHRIVLSSCCEYFKALFRSGMQESLLKVIKVPVRLKALKKLLLFFYSGSLPCLQPPEAGCMWSSAEQIEQVQYVESYLELAKLSEQWLLQDLQQQCLHVVEECLRKSLHICPKVMKIAFDFEQWDFIEVTAEIMAPEFMRLRDSGKLDDLDECIVDLVRNAHVKISMEGSK